MVFCSNLIIFNFRPGEKVDVSGTRAASKDSEDTPNSDSISPTLTIPWSISFLRAVETSPELLTRHLSPIGRSTAISVIWVS